MSSFVLRLVVGSAGTAAVGAFLITLLIVRRRKRAREQETAPRAAAAGERLRQPGLLQTLVVSVVASVISGVLLFFITPLFAPDSSGTAPRADIPQVATEDSAPAKPELPLDLDVASEEPAPEDLEPEAPPTVGPTPLEPVDTENGREPEPVIEVREPKADVLVTDTTAKWDTLLQPPVAFNEIVPGDSRLRISGASTTTIARLTAPDSRVSPEISEPRILLGQVGVSQILYPITPAPEEMEMDPRPIIEGACAVSLLMPMAPAEHHPQMQAPRVLVENAWTTLLLSLDYPELEVVNE